MELKYVGTTLLVMMLFVDIAADVYLHAPRGSNNRLNSNRRDRKNANRLFDSENNARGGYNVGASDNMVYHVGSILNIEWTNQHSCSGPNNNCDLILQYMCGDEVRDGRSESTINGGRSTNKNYGMHEDYDYYQACYYTSRNKRLFLADQNMKRDTAISTRQDGAGTRHGFECPEERDYYPYWKPSPWKDIAILTSDRTKCGKYVEESQNEKERYQCKPVAPATWRHFRKKPLPITKDECEQYKNGRHEVKWTRVPPHNEQNNNIIKPDCIVAPQSRDNHNGNGKGGFPNTYPWVIPNDVHENCVLRIRYNISTEDYDSDTFNGDEVDIASKVGLTNKKEAVEQGYVFEGNPEISPMKINGEIKKKFKLLLAINTAQFGRTFQDRSHKFSITERPKDIADNVKIHNVNVRGKRGNIVQTYPAVEYDFAPSRLTIEAGDAVHFQWTGADTNPKNNAGNGKAGTDRSNVVQIRGPQFDGVRNVEGDHGQWANNYPDHLDKTNFLGLSKTDRKKLAYNTKNKDKGGELDGTDAYFDLGARVIKDTGTYRYMCSRNNQFTNRAQKGYITIKAKTTTRDAKVGTSRTKAEIMDELTEIRVMEKEIKNMLMN